MNNDLKSKYEAMYFNHIFKMMHTACLSLIKFFYSNSLYVLFMNQDIQK